jgi:hypothetical protein
MAIRYLSTYDKNTWINKDDILKLLNSRMSKVKIIEKLTECYYKEKESDDKSTEPLQADC